MDHFIDAYTIAFQTFTIFNQACMQEIDGHFPFVEHLFSGVGELYRSDITNKSSTYHKYHVIVSKI